MNKKLGITLALYIIFIGGSILCAEFASSYSGRLDRQKAPADGALEDLTKRFESGEIPEDVYYMRTDSALERIRQRAYWSAGRTVYVTTGMLLMASVVFLWRKNLKIPLILAAVIGLTHIYFVAKWEEGLMASLLLIALPVLVLALLFILVRDAAKSGGLPVENQSEPGAALKL